MAIRKAEKGDIESVVSLGVLLWGDHGKEDLRREFSGLIASDDGCIFVMFEGEAPVGFAQCQLRHDYVEGTESSPVGYLEGIFVKEEVRRKGYGGELLRECERWAGERGCTEFASDCEFGNEDSFNFHMAMGFAEANRVICFSKELH